MPIEVAGTALIRPFSRFDRGDAKVMRCTKNALDIPDAFPCRAFARYREAARRVLETPYGTNAQSEFGGASNLIVWRFRACHEDWHAYQNWFAVSETQSSHEANFRCERALFGLFTSGVSCIESMTYSLAALASRPHMLSLLFNAQRQRACNPSWLAARLRPYAAGGRLERALRGLVAADEWFFWVDLRNRMTHRGKLPRIIRVNVGAPTPPAQPLDFGGTSSTPAIRMDTAEIERRLGWIADRLSTLLENGADLIDLRSPPVA